MRYNLEFCMGSVDHIFRENVAPVFEAFVREVLGVRPLSSERVELAQPRTSEREPDYLRKVVLPDNPNPLILHIEFEARTNTLMHYRMFEYNALLRRRFGLPVRQYVILLTGKGETMQTQIQEDDLFFRYNLVRMQEVDFNSLIESGIPELIVAAVLTDFEKKDAVGVIRRILVTLRQRVPDERELQKYLTQLEILSNFGKLNQNILKEINEMAFTYNLETDGRYKQGMQKGMLEGKVSKQLQIARDSLKNGGGIEFTAKITGLSVKKVTEIKAELDSE
ncbi:MAG: hypothetical protein LAT57_11690 [Balneolales bacterium]|nr:hypothetical protein [Balneolales bacterium]